MSYTPTEWKAGDIVTSEKLNNIEDGIEDAGSFIVTFTSREVTAGEYEYMCDKTFSEILEAFNSGKDIYAHLVQDVGGGVIAHIKTPLSGMVINNDQGEANFEVISAKNSMLIRESLSIASYGGETEDEVTVSLELYQLTPIQTP